MKKIIPILTVLLAFSFSAAQILPPIGLGDTVSISGYITENSGMLPVWIPIRGAMVVAYESGVIIMEPRVQAPLPWLVPLDTAYTDSNGNYTLKQVIYSSLPLYVQASAKGYYDSTAMLAAAGISKSKTATINFRLSRIPAGDWVLISGMVGEWPPLGGSVMPIQGAVVSLYPGGGGLIRPLALPMAVTDTTDARGNYSLLTAVDTPTLFTIYVSKEGYLPYSDTMTLAPGDTIGLAFTLVPDPSEAEAIPAALQGSRIQIYPNPACDRVEISMSGKAGEGLSCSLYDPSGRMVRSADGQAASFRLTGLARGAYFVVARQNQRVVGSRKLLLQ